MALKKSFGLIPALAATVLAAGPVGGPNGFSGFGSYGGSSGVSSHLEELGDGIVDGFSLTW